MREGEREREGKGEGEGEGEGEEDRERKKEIHFSGSRTHLDLEKGLSVLLIPGEALHFLEALLVEVDVLHVQLQKGQHLRQEVAHCVCVCVCVCGWGNVYERVCLYAFRLDKT